jgi:5'-phosphate synthase pdxT subunit
VLESLGAATIAVRTPGQLDDCDRLVIPGGESSTISMLLERSELFEPIATRLGERMPVFGTCAGAILLGREILDGRPDQRCFAAMEATIRRNAYGRQIDSFEADLDITAIEGPPLHAVFIRAPVFESVGGAVDVLGRFEGRPVLCRQGTVLSCTFHPELGDDARLHRLFLEM